MTKLSDLTDLWSSQDFPISMQWDHDSVANPCGLVAKYQFNDKFFDIRDSFSEAKWMIDD